MKRMHDKKQLGGGVTEEQFEDLVRATPTDVRAVVDQGQIQLQLEHDGNVLSIDENIGPIIQGMHGDAYSMYLGDFSISLVDIEANVNGTNKIGNVEITGIVLYEGVLTKNDLEDQSIENLIEIILRLRPSGNVSLLWVNESGTETYYGIAYLNTGTHGFDLDWYENGTQQFLSVSIVGEVGDSTLNGITIRTMGGTGSISV